MNFSSSLAFFIAAAAAPTAFASNNASSSLLRGGGYGHDNAGSGTPVPVRLLKKPDVLPDQAQANANMPELPPAAVANGQGNGGPFGNAATGCPGGWIIDKKYIASFDSDLSITWTACPTLAEKGDAVGLLVGLVTNPITYTLEEIISDKEVKLGIPTTTDFFFTVALSEDSNSFTVTSQGSSSTYVIE